MKEIIDILLDNDRSLGDLPLLVYGLVLPAALITIMGIVGWIESLFY